MQACQRTSRVSGAATTAPCGRLTVPVVLPAASLLAPALASHCLPRKASIGRSDTVADSHVAGLRLHAGTAVFAHGTARYHLHPPIGVRSAMNTPSYTARSHGVTIAGPRCVRLGCELACSNGRCGISSASSIRSTCAVFWRHISTAAVRFQNAFSVACAVTAGSCTGLALCFIFEYTRVSWLAPLP